MKTILTVLLVLVAVSSVQARVIPQDSLDMKLNEYDSTLSYHIDNFASIFKVIDAGSDFVNHSIAVRTARFIGASQDRLRNIRYYYRIFEDCETNAGCYGIAYNIQKLKDDIYEMQIALASSSHQLTVVQGNEAKKFIEQILSDMTDSNPSQACRDFVKEYLDKNK